MKTIIGLLGSAGSGKSTVAGMLEAYGYKQLAFAALVKDVCAMVFGWPRHMLEGDTKESRNWRETPDKFWSQHMKCDFTPRMAMQQVGTESFRDVFHPDIWVITVMKRINECVDCDKFVIADVRFQNEITILKNMGAKLWRINRGIMIAPLQAIESSWQDHAKCLKIMKEYNIHSSECDWLMMGPDIFDYVIDNSSTLDTLNDIVTSLVGN